MDYRVRKAGGKYWLIDYGQKAWEFKKPFAMNEIGYKIWLLLSEGKDEEEISFAIAKEYDADISVVSEDVRSFIVNLEKMKSE